jgi:hypothetical protein
MKFLAGFRPPKTSFKRKARFFAAKPQKMRHKVLKKHMFLSCLGCLDH